MVNLTFLGERPLLRARTLRQLLQLATKLHSRQRASPAPGLARQLAQAEEDGGPGGFLKATNIWLVVSNITWKYGDIIGIMG